MPKPSPGPAWSRHYKKACWVNMTAGECQSWQSSLSFVAGSYRKGRKDKQDGMMRWDKVLELKLDSGNSRSHWRPESRETVTGAQTRSCWDPNWLDLVTYLPTSDTRENDIKRVNDSEFSLTNTGR